MKPPAKNSVEALAFRIYFHVNSYSKYDDDVFILRYDTDRRPGPCGPELYILYIALGACSATFVFPGLPSGGFRVGRVVHPF